MASDELLKLESSVRQTLVDRAQVARREAEQKGIKFSMRSWALGLPGSTKYPLRPPYRVRIKEYRWYF